MVVNAVYKLQQIMSLLVLAAVIAAGVQCSNSNHAPEERTASHVHDDGTATPRIKAQSRISMNKNGYGARVQIREDLHGRKHAHAMAICDCNGQGPWRPLFKASQILRTEFPEHESFHEEVDSHYRNLVTEQVDNQLRSALSASNPSSSSSSSSSSENIVSGSDGGGGSFSGGGGSFSGGGGGGSFSGGGGSFGSGNGFGHGFGATTYNGKKHNHMIHLHLIPHIYVPIVHAAGYSEPKNYHQASDEDSGPPRSPVYQHPATVNSSPESFQSASDVSGGGVSGGGVSGGGDAIGGGATGSTGPASVSGPAEHPAVPSTAAGVDGADHGGGGGGGFNGHSGETSYYTITEDQVQHVHHDADEHQGNAVDGQSHDYEAPSSPAPDEPHQYQVHEMDDLSKDYSSKKHVTTSSNGKPHQHKHRNAVAAATATTAQGGSKAGRSKHARKLSSRQDLKNLLVMRPPPVGQTQTWRYVYHHHHHHPAVVATRHHQFLKRKLPLPPPPPPPPPMVPVLKTRTVPLILHIRQRSDD